MGLLLLELLPHGSLHLPMHSLSETAISEQTCYEISDGGKLSQLVSFQRNMLMMADGRCLG
jgi:hypothetical protein